MLPSKSRPPPTSVMAIYNLIRNTIDLTSIFDFYPKDRRRDVGKGEIFEETQIIAFDGFMRSDISARVLQCIVITIVASVAIVLSVLDCIGTLEGFG